MFVQYYLRCPKGHEIPLPRPTQVGRDDSPLEIPNTGKKLVVVCPECGLGRSYSESDIHRGLAPKLDPFQAEECLFVGIEVECDGKNCEAPKELHTLQATVQGTWRPKVVPKDWTLSDDARCEAGHRLRFNPEKKPYRAYTVRPF